MKLLISCFAVMAALLPMHAADYSLVGLKLALWISSEKSDWQIGGLAVALVDDQQIVFLNGFGEAKPDSVFRCGSISKLFNALAVMQQVEAGNLDLDSPIQRYADDLLPINPFPDEPAVTLRQILCHRSGLQRESPVGGYMDGSQPTLKATVASIRPCVLATKPGEKTRYSNIAPSLSGHLVERVTKLSFEEYQQQRLLEPLGMKSSAWTLARVPQGRLIRSHMRLTDGRGGWIRRDAPDFDLGTIPAGNLYTTAGDLARFASALLADGSGLVKPETLKEMWRPQLTNEPTGFGLGFMVGKFREHVTISHNGAVYGHSSSLVLVPDAKVAVIVLANEDIVNARVRRISNFALSYMLEAKLGENAPVEVIDERASDPALGEFAGAYESESYWADLKFEGGKLFGSISGQETKFRRVGALKFFASSRLEDNTTATFERDAGGKVSAFTLGTQRFTRVAPGPELPVEWKKALGSYGPDFIPVIVTERHRHLYAMTENMVDYRLRPVNRHVCALPPGMYVDEYVVFLPWAGRAARSDRLRQYAVAKAVGLKSSRHVGHSRFSHPSAVIPHFGTVNPPPGTVIHHLTEVIPYPIRVIPHMIGLNSHLTAMISHWGAVNSHWAAVNSHWAAVIPRRTTVISRRTTVIPHLSTMMPRLGAVIPRPAALLIYQDCSFPTRKGIEPQVIGITRGSECVH